MKVRFSFLALVTALCTPFVSADDGGTDAGWRARSASGTMGAMRSAAPDVRLVGINLYDAGLRVLQVYGDPDEIQAVGAGGGGAAGAGGFGGPRAGGFGQPGAGPAGRAGGGGGGAGALQPSAESMAPNPFGMRDQFGSLPFLLQDQDDVNERGRGSFGPPGAPQRPPLGGPPSAGPGGFNPGGAPAGGAPAAGNAGESRILFTRWIYRQPSSRYGFIFDRANRVVQIEAIGSQDRRVFTNRGIRFGSTFADIIRRYGAPDGYEINGESLVVRYLVRQKIAFRLNRLERNRPHVVTGVVVAAGKQ